MKLRILESSEEPLMLELLHSEKESRDSDFYLDRGKSFWGLYDWYSEGQQFAIGVFDNQLLVGMVVLIKMPFQLIQSDSDLYLVTDMLIRPSYRRSFAAARLFTGLHTFIPNGKFINIWIENRVGFAEATPKFSKRMGRVTATPRQTSLITLYPNRPIGIEPSSDYFEFSSSWQDIETHLELYRNQNSTWITWNSKIDLKDKFRKVIHFKTKGNRTNLSGLIVDRGNLQSVCWNGQPRILVEKFRRSLAEKNVMFSEDDELPFATVGFLINAHPEQKISTSDSEFLFRWGYENNYFGINFRDVEIEFSKKIDRADFPRRIFLSTSQSETYLHKVISGLSSQGVALESIYL